MQELTTDCAIQLRSSRTEYKYVSIRGIRACVEYGYLITMLLNMGMARKQYIYILKE